MSLSRRALMGDLGGNTPLPSAFIAARGREALVAEHVSEAAESLVVPPVAADEVRISSNENPLGPGPKALEALRGAFGVANRYPTNTSPSMADLRAILAENAGAQPANVVLGAGSGEILKNGVHAFTSPTRPLVTATPSYEQPPRVARYLGTDVRRVPVDDQGRLDLEAMADASRGAGLVFVCNPNNPTSTVHSGDAIAEFVSAVHGASPDTVIHIDEAYHEYVTDPAYYSAAALALETPNLFVSRTFSKAYGMAGMRVGFGIGHRDTIAELGRFSLTFNTNSLGQIAAHAAAQDADYMRHEKARNAEVKKLTVDFFESAGYNVFDSQTNFVFVDIGQPAAGFRDACRAHEVRVGRDFPPFEKTHCRISIGTREEMERAIEVFDQVLEG